MMSMSRLRTGRSFCLWLAGAATVPALAGVAVAQEASPSPPPPPVGTAAPDQGPALDDIVVTAQKRSQNVQDVPISIAVVSGEAIANQNFRSLGDLSRNQPAFSVAPVGRSVRMSLRGISSGTNTAFDQSVVTFIDDVYHGKARSSGSLLLDIDRIELLKGPQTTFFGNNAIAGAINVQSARPRKDYGGSARLLYGAQGEYAAEAVLNVPLSHTLAIRVAGLANGMNGYIIDRTGGTKAPHERNYAGRITARWAPTGTFTLFLKAEMTDNRMRGGIGSQIVDCPPRAPFVDSSGNPVPGRFCPEIIAAGGDTKLNYIRDMSPGQVLNLSTQDYLANATLNVGGATLTWVTAYSSFKFLNNQDSDGGPDVLLHLRAPQRFNQFSQELRLASDDINAPISYIAGIYYQTSKFYDRSESTFGFLTPVINASAPLAGLRGSLPFGQVVDVVQDEQTVSGFASLTWRPTSALSLTAGGRLTRVEKTMRQAILYGQGTQDGFGSVAPYVDAQAALAGIFGAGAGLGTQGTRNFTRADNRFTPTANVRYEISRTINLYASYSQGFKAGGFNGTLTTGGLGDVPFNPEYVTAYEAGLRSELFDRRLLLNGTIFRSNYRDLQTSIFAAINGQPVSIVQNAASSVSQGIEIETKLAVSNALTIGSAMTFLDSKFKDFPNAAPTAAQRFAGAIKQDLSGKPTAYAPKFAATFYATYKQPVGKDLNVVIDGNVLFQSSYYTADQVDPNLRQLSYAKFDLRAALSTADGAWEIAVIGKNLTDRKIIASGIDSGGLGTYFLTLERPRSVAMQLRHKW